MCWLLEISESLASFINSGGTWAPQPLFSSVYAFTSTEFIFLLAFYLLEYTINNNRCIINTYLYMCVPDTKVCWFNMYIVVFHYNQNQVMNNRALSVIWQQSSALQTSHTSIALKQEQIVIIISYTIQCIRTYLYFYYFSIFLCFNAYIAVLILSL